MYGVCDVKWSRQACTKAKGKKKQERQVKRAKHLTPTHAIDELIGDEQQNGKQEEKNKTGRRRESLKDA